MDGPSPMDIDPVDDGPREAVQGLVPMTGSTGPATFGSSPGPMHEISKEEEARQAIDMLRGDDVAQRVAAASRLKDVAAVLGPKRTREVSEKNTQRNLETTTHISILSLVTTGTAPVSY